MSKTKDADGVADDMQNMPFEEAVKKLESIVEAMESQDLPLESLLAKYEEGTRLAQMCQVRLNEADMKIQQLEKTARGEIALKPAAFENPSQEREGQSTS